MAPRFLGKGRPFFWHVEDDDADEEDDTANSCLVLLVGGVPSAASERGENRGDFLGRSVVSGSCVPLTSGTSVPTSPLSAGTSVLAQKHAHVPDVSCGHVPS